MDSTPIRCLILACGNTLRSDDGIGPWLADWAAQRFEDELGVRVISRQQWTPELAEDLAAADTAIFLDCSTETVPGSVNMIAVQAAPSAHDIDTHRMGAPELLAVAHELYDALPRTALLLTIGAGSTELGEQFSQAVLDAIPVACAKLDQTVAKLLLVK